jgi:hypothetical protein
MVGPFRLKYVLCTRFTRTRKFVCCTNTIPYKLCLGQGRIDGNEQGCVKWELGVDIGTGGGSKGNVRE